MEVVGRCAEPRRYADPLFAQTIDVDPRPAREVAAKDGAGIELRSS